MGFAPVRTEPERARSRQDAAGRWRHPVRLLRVRPDLAPVDVAALRVNIGKSRLTVRESLRRPGSGSARRPEQACDL
ncbi:hypothetical protein E1265_27140 [Streptomyces sp. 8K308]|nr:hypothetical protein E1265_27140 [Streptomyces sp. 8K308]